ncbi:hypothetical protein CLIM01_13032 [Colletotrichum limetticola]|uniref:BTB domain-containing protein n=1 Tax=Colletotrichum limetticola TaxID=1209924 RepID=A0ABQ9PC69_9PEZI|nr:hypothetical protein CLIM01_13032 [Colletotrichum limetticola]
MPHVETKRDIDVAEILKSRIIKFIVGEDKVEYNVHEAAISGLSGPLRALVTNGMKESVEGVVVWDEVEPEVFTQLVQFAYGHYLSLHDYDMKSEGTFQVSFPSQSLQFRLWFADYSPLEDEGPPVVPELLFGSSRFERRMPKKSRAAGGPYLVTYHSEDFFMAHARLYCFADQYGVADLAAVCVEKLQSILYEHPANDVLNQATCKLLLFVWPRTVPEDELRLLLIDFILTNLSNALTTNMKLFGPVLDEIPEIAVAILRSAPREYWQALKRSD